MNAFRRWMIRALAGKTPVVLNVTIAAVSEVKNGTRLTIGQNDDQGLIDGCFLDCGVLGRSECPPRCTVEPLMVAAPFMELAENCDENGTPRTCSRCGQVWHGPDCGRAVRVKASLTPHYTVSETADMIAKIGSTLLNRTLEES